MDPAEQALLQALEASPEDWSIRLLIAEKQYARGAEEDAVVLIEAAPEPPSTAEELQKVVTIAGLRSLPQARNFVAENPADGYGHQILSYLFEHAGDAEKAAKHTAAARALGISAMEDPVEREAPDPQTQGQPSYDDPPAGTQSFQNHAPPPSAVSQSQSQPTVSFDESYIAPKKKQAGSKVTAILVALGIHVLIGVIAAILVILPPARDEPEIVAAIIGPPAARQEMQKKNVVKQVKKSTSAASAAAPVAQLMRASAMAKFSLPKVTKTSTGPLGMGEGNLGSGGFGGTGSGLGSGASFFGGTAKGERFLFVLDHSASMKKHQVALRNNELERALKALDGVQYQVLLFAGAAYYAQKGWSIKGNTVVTDARGKTYRFRQKKISDFDFIGADSQLPKTDWLDASSTNKKATLDFIKKTPLFGGTDWEMALKIGHYMDPPPDVIFFMSDGTGGNDPRPILSLNRNRSAPVINTIAMQTGNGAKQFGEVAKGTKGKFTIVDKKGKPIDGFEYLKNPGKFKGRL